MKFKTVFSLFAISAVLLTSCSVTRSPVRSPSMIVDVENAATATMLLYQKMSTAADRTYKNFEQDYKKVSVQIDAIVTKDQVRPRAEKLLKLATMVQENFRRYQANHNARGNLAAGELSVFSDYMRAFWKPLLVAELSLK